MTLVRSFGLIFIVIGLVAGNVVPTVDGTASQGFLGQLSLTGSDQQSHTKTSADPATYRAQSDPPENSLDSKLVQNPISVPAQLTTSSHAAASPYVNGVLEDPATRKAALDLTLPPTVSSEEEPVKNNSNIDGEVYSSRSRSHGDSSVSQVAPTTGLFAYQKTTSHNEAISSLARGASSVPLNDPIANGSPSILQATHGHTQTSIAPLSSSSSPSLSNRRDPELEKPKIATSTSIDMKSSQKISSGYHSITTSSIEQSSGSPALTEPISTAYSSLCSAPPKSSATLARHDRLSETSLEVKPSGAATHFSSIAQSARSGDHKAVSASVLSVSTGKTSSGSPPTQISSSMQYEAPNKPGRPSSETSVTSTSPSPSLSSSTSHSSETQMKEQVPNSIVTLKTSPSNEINTQIKPSATAQSSSRDERTILGVQESSKDSTSGTTEASTTNLSSESAATIEPVSSPSAVTTLEKPIKLQNEAAQTVLAKSEINPPVATSVSNSALRTDSSALVALPVSDSLIGGASSQASSSLTTLTSLPVLTTSKDMPFLTDSAKVPATPASATQVTQSTPLPVPVPPETKSALTPSMISSQKEAPGQTISPQSSPSTAPPTSELTSSTISSQKEAPGQTISPQSSSSTAPPTSELTSSMISSQKEAPGQTISPQSSSSTAPPTSALTTNTSVAAIPKDNTDSAEAPLTNSENTEAENTGAASSSPATGTGNNVTSSTSAQQGPVITDDVVADDMPIPVSHQQAQSTTVTKGGPNALRIAALLNTVHNGSKPTSSSMSVFTFCALFLCALL